MSSRQTRGPHPRDQELFGSGLQVKKLRLAVRDLSWLLTAGYPEKAALKLVGDRYKLTRRQRMATGRCACNEELATQISKTAATSKDLPGSTMAIDGFNIIITVETWISNGYMFQGRDGVVRDISGVHGSYKLLGVTGQAIEKLVSYLQEMEAAEVRWYFDKPVSNSGRLAQLATEIAGEYGLKTTAQVVFNPDRLLINGHGIVVSSDSQVLHQCSQWLNLRGLFQTGNSDRIIDLSGP